MYLLMVDNQQKNKMAQHAKIRKKPAMETYMCFCLPGKPRVST